MIGLRTAVKKTVLLLLFSIAAMVLSTCRQLTPGLGEEVDIESPTLTITSHSSGDYVSDGFTLLGTAEDDISVASVTITLDDQTFAADFSDGQWSLSVDTADFSNGHKNVTITASDGAERSSSETVLLIFDTIAPTVLVTSPQEYGVDRPTKSTYIDIRGEAYDANPIQAVSVSVYDGSGSLVASQDAEGTNTWFARFVFNGEFPDKANYGYFVTVTDATGNTNTYIYHAADIWDLLPAGDSFPPVNTIGSVDQTGTTSDTYPDLTQSALRAVKLESPDLPDFYVDRDTDLPQITFSNLDPNLAVTENVLGRGTPVSGYVTDDKEGIDLDSFIFKVYDATDDSFLFDAPVSTTSPGDGLMVNFSAALENGGSVLENGRYRGVLSVADKAGKGAEGAVSFIIDSSAPRFIDVDPGDTEFTEYLGIDGLIHLQAEDDNSIEAVTARAFDAIDGVEVSEITVTVSPDSSGSTYDGYITAVVPDTYDGQVFLKIELEDESGRTVHNWFVYEIDKGSPSLTFDRPLADSIVDNDALSVEGSASDDTDPAPRVYVWLDNGQDAMPGDPANGDWTGWTRAEGSDPWRAIVNLADLAEGAYSIHAYSEDSAGNKSAEVVRSFNYDLAEPTLTESNHTEENAYLETAYSLTGTVSDSHGLVNLNIVRTRNDTESIIVLDEDLTEIPAGTAYNWSLEDEPDVSLTNGRYDYTITVTDLANRQAVLNRTVSLDNQGPSVTINNPLETDWLSGTLAPASGTASDVGSQVTDVLWSINGTDWQSANGTLSWTATLDLTAFPSEGQQTLYVKSVDLAGNESTPVTRTFGLDRSAPVITETTVGSGTVFRNAGFSLGGTLSDTNGITELLVIQSKNSGAAVTIVDDTALSGTSDSLAVSNLPRNPDSPSVQLVEDGSYEYILTLTDVAGRTASVTRTVNVDVTAPSVQIVNIYPMIDDRVNGSITLSAGATDENGLTGVKWWASPAGSTQPDFNGTAGGTAFASAPYTVTIDTDASLTDTQTYRMWVVAKDKAGNQGGASYDIQVLQESDRPIITGNSISLTGPNALGRDPAILFTVEDDDAVDTDMIEYRLDGGAWTNAGITNPDSALVQARTTLTGIAQGQHTIRFRAMDTTPVSLGDDWITVYGDAANYHWTETADYPLTVDYGPPEVTLSSPTASSVFKDDFNVTGSAVDFNGVSSVEIEMQHAGLVKTYLSGIDFVITPTTDTTPVDFTFSIPVDTDVFYEDGDYNLQVRAADGSGTVGTVDRPLGIDQTPPTVTFTQPPADSVVNGAVTIRGEVDDNRQVTHTYLWHGLQSATPPDLSDPSWDDLGSSLVWSYDLDTSPVAPTGAYKVVAVTEDVSGNLSDYQTLNLSVDQTTDRPVLSLTNLVEGASDNILGRNAKITGNVEDDDGVAPDGIEIRIDPDPDAVGYPNDDNGWTVVSDPPSSTGTLVSWYHDVSALAQGPHTVQLRVRDKNTPDNTVYGDAADYRWTVGPVVDFYIDYGPPTLTISGPVSGSVENSNFDIYGTATDANSVASVQISFNGGAWQDVTTTNAYANWTYSYTAPAAGTAEEVVAYQVRALDNALAETTLDRQVVIDVNPPDITGISQPTLSQIVNGTIDLSGQATDGYDLDAVYYHVGPEYLDGFSEAPVFDPLNPSADWTLLSGSYAWSATGVNGFDTTTLADGDYTLYVVGVDSGNNYTEVNNDLDPSPRCNFSIDQASDRPVLSLSTLSTTAGAADNLLPPSLQISGTAEDDDAVKSGLVEIQVDANNDGDFDDGGLENWDVILGPPSYDANVVTWSHTFNGLGDGQYSFRLRAADVNFQGNYETEEFSWDYLRRADDGSIAVVPFSIDLNNPAGTVTTPEQGSYHNTDVEISGTASDANGIKSVKIKFGTDAAIPLTPVTSNDVDYTWSYDYTLAGDGQVSYQIIITDNYEKIITLDRYFTIDTTGPTIGFFQPGDGDTANGSLLVRGEANDGRLVDKVYAAVTADGGATPGDPLNGDWTGWNLAAGDFSWNYRVNTTLYADAPYDIHVRAVDGAGNVSGDNILNVNFSQTGNYPVFSQLNMNAAPEVNLFGSGDVISGTVTDDDGVDASTIEIRFDINNDGDFDDGGFETWTPVNDPGSSGMTVSFSHDLEEAGLPEGPNYYPAQVRVSDIGETDYGVPAVTTTTPSYYTAFDKDVPALTLESITLEDRYTLDERTITGAAMNGARLNNNYTLHAAISDTGGIDTVSVSINGGSYTDTGVTDNGDGTWSLYRGIDMDTNKNDGNTNLTVKVVDTWGRETTESVTVVIDTTEPVVTYIEPAADADVNGTVTVRGTTLDNSIIQSLLINAGRDNSTISPVTLALEDGSTYDSWITSFDAYAYDEAAYATDQGDNRWLFPLSVTAVDSAGNKKTALRDVYLDPDGDKPVVVNETFLPENESSVAGTIVLQSTVTDDDAPAFVRVYVDLDDDGILTAGAYPVDLSDPADGDTADAFEEEDNFLEVAVNNGVWTALVNQNGEFGKAALAARGVPSPTGWIQFHVVPYDTNGTPGSPAVRRVYVDATAPEILGVNHVSGDLVKGPVTLSGTIRDDRVLPADYIQISYDGGSTFQSLPVTGPTSGGGYETYSFSMIINTDAAEYFPSDSGILYIVIKVTDSTYKQSSLNINLNVDNELPTAVFDYNNSLPYVGTSPRVYTFRGDQGDTDATNQVLGSAGDTGLVSGIEKVTVYFVKDGNFESPKAAIAPTAVTPSTAEDELYDQSGILAEGVPFTTSTDYLITIQNRIEQGQFDGTDGIGDQDGFQESLKAKTGFDEWYAFFDTSVFPDGPLDLYYVAYDEAGNKSYGMVAAQVSNNPPSIDSFDINGPNYDDEYIQVKLAGTVNVTMNVSDVEGIDTASYEMTVAEKYAVGAGGSVGAEDTGFVPVSYAVADFTNVTAASADLAIDTTALASGSWYRVEAGIGDSDGNRVTRDWWLWVNNEDSAAPSVTLDAFTQDHDTGSGHIEEADNSPDSDGQADLSGTVKVTGTAYDDSAVSSVILEIYQTDLAAWVDIGAAILVNADDGDVTNGIDYTWSYTWDTSGITGVADEDILLRVRASDGTNTTAEADRALATVDVVPYISDIITGYEIGLKTFIKRSALGKYTVAQGSTVTITGYNLPGTAVDAVKLLDTSTDPDTTISLTGTAAVGTTEVDIDLTGVSPGGYLSVVTNGVSSRNNTNNNALPQNDESGQYYPDRNDDRYLALWELTDTGYSGDDAVMRPARDAAGNQTGMDWMYVTTSDTLYLNADKMTSSFTLSGGDFGYNDNGTRLWAFIHDAKWWITETNAANIQYYGSIQWSMQNGYTYTSGRDEAYNWNIAAQTARLGLGNMVYPDGTTGQIDRYQNLQMRLVGGNTFTANLVGYYDGNTASQGIVFVAFNTGTGVADTNYDLNGSWYSTIERVNPYDKAYSVTGNEGLKATGIGNPVYANTANDARNLIVSGDDSSSAFALVTGSDGTAYLVWYDPSDGGTGGFAGAGVKFMYNTDPVGTPATWSAPVTVASNPTDTPYGHLAMKIDPAGGVHIAYQDSNTGFLNYTWAATAADVGTTMNSVMVDALFSSGQYNSMVIKEFGTADYRPVITTFSSAYTGTKQALRLVYPLSSPASVGDGADLSGDFTGAWESIAVPAATVPGSAATFTETSGTAAGAGNPVIGYNGLYMEQARFLDLP